MTDQEKLRIYLEQNLIMELAAADEREKRIASCGTVALQCECWAGERVGWMHRMECPMYVDGWHR